MDRLSVLTILVFFCSFANAQDTIVKSNGDKICAKITEVSITEIKYKKFDFQDGPTFIESKSNIQLIKYSNGSEEKIDPQQTANTVKPVESTTDYYVGPVEHPNNKISRQGNRFQYQGEVINERAMQDVLYKSNDKQIILLAGSAKDAKNFQYIGFGAIPFGVGALYFLTKSMASSITYNNRGANSGDLTLSAICCMGAISCPIASGYFKHKRTISNREAIKLYNAKY